MDPLLVVEGVTVQFGKGCSLCANLTGPEQDRNRCPRCGTIVACHKIGFELFEGDSLGIMGESGSGKTTLLNVLSFHTHAMGKMSLHADAVPPLLRTLLVPPGKTLSNNLLSLSPYYKRRLRDVLIGIVHQHPARGLRMEVSAGGNIVERLLDAGWRHVENMRRRASELLEQTEVPIERMDEPPKVFSGGMQQRVQIAKALAHAPLILLLDEITTGLDLSVQARVLDLIRQLRDNLNLTMIVVSHDLGVVRLLCQRTIVLKHGRVVESGLTDQILLDPHHPYTQLLVASQL